MRVVFSGGGTGGHFYPIIAVAQELNKLAKERNIEVKLYYLAPSSFEAETLKANNIKFKKIRAGKVRKNPSGFRNFLDIFRTISGVLTSIWHLFVIYPDVVFGKGGYASFPVILAARLLFIPVVIHESDTIPGKANKWAGKFARRIAISFPKAVEYFPKEKTAYTGNPIRSEIIDLPNREQAREQLNLEKYTKTIMVIGGSQGSQAINEVILEALPELIKKYQIVHQAGKNNFNAVKATSEAILSNNPHKNRYRIFPYLNTEEIRLAAGSADLVISRAGSSIFEIAAWRLPSIIVPIPESISHDQRSNAFAYAREDACLVIEEDNFDVHVLLFEIEELFGNPEKMKSMAEAAQKIVKPKAGEIIAKEIINIASKHEN